MSLTFKHFSGSGCPVNANEELDITVPVTVQASSDIGDVVIRCMNSTINRNTNYAPGDPNAISKFTVSQRIHVDIPLIFNADIGVGDGYVEFLSSNNPC